MALSEESIIQCKICQKTFTKRNSLKQHVIDIHEQSGKFACGFCEKMFYKKSTKVIHERKHTRKREDKNPYVCQSCPKTYDRMSILETHIQLNHKIVDDDCLLPKIEVTNTENLLPTTNIQCQLCQKTFTRKSSLKYHVQDIHEKSGDIACGFCDEKFIKKSRKIMHEKVHTGEKPHMCDECGKTFPRKSSVVEHSRYVHKKERNFACEVCSKTFSRKTEFIYHLKNHIGEISNACDICGKSFESKSSLTRHSYKHTEHQQVFKNVVKKTGPFYPEVKSKKLNNEENESTLLDTSEWEWEEPNFK